MNYELHNYDDIFVLQNFEFLVKYYSYLVHTITIGNLGKIKYLLYCINKKEKIVALQKI